MSAGYERASWRKVWAAVWSSPSHLGLHRDVLWVCVTMIVHAAWKRGEDEAVMLVGLLPMPASALADVCRMPTKRLSWCVAQLIERGTVVRRGDLLVLPQFARWQESASASRVRKHRVQKRYNGSQCNADETLQGEGEGEGEGEGDLTSPTATVAPAKRRPTRDPSPDACEIAQYLYDAIRSHDPEFLAAAKPAVIDAKLAGWARAIDTGMRNDGMTAELCRHAIDAAHRSSDTFWRTNLLSGAKLRKHYDALRIRKKATAAPDYSQIDYDAVGAEMDRWTSVRSTT